MSNNSFVPTSAIATTTTATAAAIAPTMFAEMSDLDKVKSYLANQYALEQLVSCISYPTEGPAAGRALLTIPSALVHNGKGGYFMIKVCFPEISGNGVVKVRVALSFKQKLGTNQCELLTRGGGDGNKVGWLNIKSNLLPLGDLFAAGYFEDSVKEEIFNWATGDRDREYLDLKMVGDFQLVLRANKAGKVVDFSRSKYAPGEDTGLGVDQIGFQGATLLPRSSDLLFASTVEGVIPVTIADMRAAYGFKGGAAPSTHTVAKGSALGLQVEDNDFV